MNKYLKKFDTIKFVATWSIFKNFLRIFYFLEFKFEFWIWAGLKPAGTGPDRFDRLPVKPDRFRSEFLTLVRTWRKKVQFRLQIIIIIICKSSQIIILTTRNLLCWPLLINLSSFLNKKLYLKIELMYHRF